jgi:hypothetical protein
MDLSDVCSESFPKLVGSLDAEMLAINETVVSMRVQLVNGMKKPSRSIYKK